MTDDVLCDGSVVCVRRIGGVIMEEIEGGLTEVMGDLAGVSTVRGVLATTPDTRDPVLLAVVAVLARARGRTILLDVAVATLRTMPAVLGVMRVVALVTLVMEVGRIRLLLVVVVALAEVAVVVAVVVERLPP